MPPPFDAKHRATQLVNELYYRDGPTPKPLALDDATLVRDTVAEALIEAFAAGMSNLAPIKDEDRKTASAVIEFFKQFEEPPLPPYDELRLENLGLLEYARRYGFKDSA